MEKKQEGEGEVTPSSVAEVSSVPQSVRLTLVSFGWSFGPERRRRPGGRGGGSGSGGGGVWAGALNLRKFANPPASMRRRGLTGLDSELQDAVWAQPKAESMYASVLGEVQKLLVDGIREAAEAKGRGRTELEDEDADSEHCEEESTSSASEGSSDDDDEEETEQWEEEEDEEAVEDDQATDGYGVTITVGLGCEKGKHRSVAVVERLLREEGLRSATIEVNGCPVTVPVDVVVHHRDLHKTGKDAQRGRKARDHAEARQRKRAGW